MATISNMWAGMFDFGTYDVAHDFFSDSQYYRVYLAVIHSGTLGAGGTGTEGVVSQKSKEYVIM